MKKIDLKICMGTMCYVMGGAELKDAIDSLGTADAAAEVTDDTEEASDDAAAEETTDDAADTTEEAAE